MTKQVDDYLKEGIYGAKQTKPDERRKYLGTIRERIVLALTKGQVMKNLGLKELEHLMKEHPKTKLLLNGNMRSTYFSKYRKLAGKNHVPYTIVANQNSKTEIAAILTYEKHAIEKEDIFIKELPVNKQSEKSTGKIASFFKQLFTGPKE